MNFSGSDAASGNWGLPTGDIDKLGDVAGYNGDGARLYLNPGFPSVVTEYGSTVADRPGKYEPGWGGLDPAPGAVKNQIGSWRFPWRSGESIWCAFDHGSIAGRKFGAMGLIDYFRLPKRQWYWYHATKTCTSRHSALAKLTQHSAAALELTSG